MTAPSHRAGSTHGLVDQAWARRGSISSTARSDAGRREGKPRASTDQSAGKLGRSSVRKVVRKNPSRIVVVSLIPWRSSRPNPFLYRQQSRVERVGVRTRHDPFQRELRMQGIHENIPFAGSDHGRHPQCRQIVTASRLTCMRIFRIGAQGQCGLRTSDRECCRRSFLTLKNRKFAPVGKDEIPTCDGGRAVTHAVNTKTACNHYRSITELD
jgi:hypothetical protein